MNDFLNVFFIALFCWSGRNRFVESAANPAFKIRVSQQGLNYAGSVALDVLSKKVVGLPIPDAENFRGSYPYYKSSGGKIASFTKPRSSVTVNSATGDVTWSLSGAASNLRGKFWFRTYSILWFTISDDVEYSIEASGISMSLSATLGRSSSGELTISSTGCTSDIYNVHLSLYGGWSWLYNLFIGSYGSQVKQFLKEGICKAAKDAINLSGSQQLAAVKWRIPFDDEWVFDYSLQSVPRFDRGYVETAHNCELMRNGLRTGTPLPPPPMTTLPSVSRMVTVYMSAYVMNNIAQILFDNHNLLMSYTQELESDRIFGDKLLSQDAFQNGETTLQVTMTATSPPTMQFPGAYVTGFFSGVVVLQARFRNNSIEEIISAQVNATIAVSPHFNGTLLTATASVLAVTPTNVRLTGNSGLLRSRLTDFERYAIFSYIVTSVVIPNLNDVGQRGFPVVHLLDVDFPSAALVLQDGVARLETDVRYQPRAG